MIPIVPPFLSSCPHLSSCLSFVSPSAQRRSDCAGVLPAACHRVRSSEDRGVTSPRCPVPLTARACACRRPTGGVAQITFVGGSGSYAPALPSSLDAKGVCANIAQTCALSIPPTQPRKQKQQKYTPECHRAFPVNMTDVFALFPLLPRPPCQHGVLWGEGGEMASSLGGSSS